jgi:DNA-binding transcriptional LysR family regulator
MSFQPSLAVLMAAVAEEQSFTRAAARLGVPQPKVSLGIRRLETQLGFPVFIRTTRHVTLTADGARLLPYVQEIARACESAQNFVQSLEMRHQGTLRVGSLDASLSIGVRTELIKGFIDRYPRVELVLEVGATPELIAQVESGELDAVLTFGVPGRWIADMEIIPLQRSTAVLCIPVESPLARYDEVPVAALAGSELMLSPGRICPEVVIQLRAQLEGMSVRVRNAPEANRDTILHMARARRMMIFMWQTHPEAVLTAPGDMVLRPVEGDPFFHDFSLIRRRNHHGVLLRKFCDLARQVSEREAVPELMRPKA